MDHVAKIREARRVALAVKQKPSELLLKELDRARQGGLRHIAPLACAGEIQLLGYREEITNLMHFHGDLEVSSRRWLEFGWCSLRIV
jgi:hypothetical protein